jgi:hypothetical protein
MNVLTDSTCMKVLNYKQMKQILSINFFKFYMKWQ